MFVIKYVTVAVLLAACASVQQTTPAPAHGVEYRGGLWFDGTRFTPRTMYVADGVFHSARPQQVDSVVDLRGGYVVPPFSDAHQHLIDPRIDMTIRAFLSDGIFYVKDQGNAPVMRRMIDPLLNKPSSFDYISANQAWTSPGGHPVEVIKRAPPMPGPMMAFLRDSLDPGIVNQVDTKADIDKRWAYFLAGKPDFVKLHLLTSEDYARRRSEALRFEGNRGIDPALVPYIVQLAHAAGLQVSAHVYTAADFRAAVNGGVDQIAHLPGGKGADSIYMLNDGDGANAAAHHVTVITTLTQHQDSALIYRLLRTQSANNINVLRRHNVPILIGSDVIGSTAAPEVALLAQSGLFTNLELLRMWSVTTPQAIFPKRRIGVLADGYEASFLVLRADPIADIAATRSIAMRVKQGEFVDPAAKRR